MNVDHRGSVLILSENTFKPWTSSLDTQAVPGNYIFVQLDNRAPSK